MAKKHDIRETESMEPASVATDGIVTRGSVTQTAEPVAQLPLAVTIAVPLADVACRRHFLTHVDVRLTTAQSLTLQKLAAGLRQSNERLTDGRVFGVGDNGEERGSVANAVQWILEQVASEAVR